jgi:hypothetical protein
MSILADRAFGAEGELNVGESLNRQFNTTLERRGGFYTFDYGGTLPTGRTIELELKTRRIRHDQYPTTMVGRNKIEYCSNANTDYYFVFNFSDGIYYIKYDKALFASFECRNDFVRSQRSDCPNPVQSVVYIPNNLLIPLTPV